MCEAAGRPAPSFAAEEEEEEAESAPGKTIVPKKMKKCSAGGVLQTKQQPLVNRHKMTELHQAALSGDVATIQHIMKNGFDPDQVLQIV